MKIWLTSLMLFLSASLFAADENAVSKVPYLKLFKQKAVEYDLPVSALIAISHLTTNFNSEFLIPKRCGLMYVESTLPVFFDDNIDCLDPLTNIDIGASVLRDLLNETKSIEKALQSYKYGYWENEKRPPKDKEELDWEKNILKIYRAYKPHYK